jgi:hypothetical protein
MNIREIAKNKSFQFWAFFAGLFALSFFIFFWRFPDAFFQTNFYAEDATFSLKIIDKQFFGALFERFNGYYIFGLYILTGIALFLNKIIFADFLSLPKSIALISYAFFSFSVTLPILLFWNKIKKTNLVFLVVLSSFVPLAGFDYAVIGNVGNLKFIFSYIAFLFIVYRIYLPEGGGRGYILADFVIFICAYTNPAVYLLFPVIYFSYLRKVFLEKSGLRGLLKDKSFLSVLILALALAVQLIVIKLQGIPELRGYMNESFDYKKTIEIFLARPYLYAVIYNFFDRLNDFWSLFLFSFLCILAWIYGRKKWIYLFSVYSILAITVIFVSARTGVHVFFDSYKMPSGPSQFFYTQNLIFYFIFIWFLQEFFSHIEKQTKVLIFVFVAGFFLLSFPKSGSFGKNNAMLQVGTFEENAKKACKTSNHGGDKVKVVLYPNPDMTITELFPKKLICH